MTKQSDILTQHSIKIQNALYQIVYLCEYLIDTNQFCNIAAKIKSSNIQVHNIINAINPLMNKFIEKTKEFEIRQQSHIKQNQYLLLQKYVQKCQGQIRKYIQVQHQMKLYTDMLQEKVQEYQKLLLEQKQKLVRVEKRLIQLEKEKHELIQNLKISQTKLFLYKQKKQINDVNQKIKKLKKGSNFSLRQNKTQINGYIVKIKPSIHQKNNISEIQDISIMLNKKQDKINKDHSFRKNIKNRNSINIKQNQKIIKTQQNTKVLNSLEDDTKVLRFLHPRKCIKTQQVLNRKQARSLSGCK